MPFNENYDIGMNGGNPGASQWFKLNIEVNEDGSIVIQNTLDNDTLQGWSDSYRFEFHDVRDNTLLFYVDSPTYSIGAKPPGQHVMQQADPSHFPSIQGLLNASLHIRQCMLTG